MAPPRRLGRTIFWLAVTGVSIYLVFPSIVEVFGSWRQITRFSLWSLLVMAGLQARRSPRLWALQHVALPARAGARSSPRNSPGNALSKIAPGGGAMGSALQYRILVQAGAHARRDRGRADRGQRAGVRGGAGAAGARDPGAAPRRCRSHAARDGVRRPGRLRGGGRARRGAADHGRPAGWVGRTVQRVRNRLRRNAEPLQRLPERLLRERDRILATLGPRWKRALLATVGRWTFDYLTLLAALAAIGSHPRPGPRPARVLRRAGARADPDHARAGWASSRPA